MAQTIKFTYDKTKYTLEFTRNSVKEMEAEGFVLEETQTKPVTNIPILFHGAFLANHSDVDDSVIEEIYSKLPDKMQLIENLLKMYNDTVNTLIAEPTSDEGNISWRVNK